MRRLVGVAFVALLAIGCKGEKGPKGDKGDPGQVTTYSGGIFSNDQDVSVPAYTAGADISVFLVASDGAAELPYYLPGPGVNTFYLAVPGLVSIFNGALAGASTYKIVVTTPYTTASMRLLGKD